MGKLVYVLEQSRSELLVRMDKVLYIRLTGTLVKSTRDSRVLVGDQIGRAHV